MITEWTEKNYVKTEWRGEKIIGKIFLVCEIKNIGLYCGQSNSCINKKCKRNQTSSYGIDSNDGVNGMLLNENSFLTRQKTHHSTEII